MKKKIVGITIFLACQAASAGDWYIGASLGSAKAEDASSNISADMSALAGLGISSSASFDDKARSYSIFGGYQANDNLAIEASYDYLGTYQFSGAAAAGGIAVSGNEEDKVDAFSLSAVLAAPLTSSFSVYGKAGVAASSDKMTCAVAGGTCKSEKDSATGPMFGAGASVAISSGARLRLEYDQFNDIGDNNNEYTAGNFSVIKLEIAVSI